MKCMWAIGVLLMTVIGQAAGEPKQPIQIQPVALSLTVEKVWEKQVVGKIQQVIPGEKYPSAVITDQKIYLFKPDGLVETEVTLQRGERGHASGGDHFFILGPSTEPFGDLGDLKVFSRAGGKIFEKGNVPQGLYLSKTDGFVCVTRVGEAGTLKQIHFFDQNGVLQKKYEFGRGGGLEGSFSPNGDLFIAVMDGEPSSTRIMAFTMNGQLLWEKKIPDRSERNHDGHTVSISPDGRFFVVRLYGPAGEGFTYLFDQNGHVLNLFGQAHSCNRFTSDSKFLITKFSGSNSQVFDLTDMKVLENLPVPQTTYSRLQDISSDNKWLVAGGEEGSPKILILSSVDGGRTLGINGTIVGALPRIPSARFSQNSQHLILFLGDRLFVLRVHP